MTRRQLHHAKGHDLGPLPFSICSYHNDFFHQARDAFVGGNYFPALTAACALGERILNHLVLDLRDYYKDNDAYPSVAENGAFSNWKLCIRVLKEWGVLEPGVDESFAKLGSLRHRSLHFNANTYANAYSDSLQAITCLRKIIEGQFASIGRQRWFIEGIKGCCFIRKQSEEDPFVKEYFLKQCPRLGPAMAFDLDAFTKIGLEFPGVVAFDWKEYGPEDVDDGRFAKLVNCEFGGERRGMFLEGPRILPPNDDVIAWWLQPRSVSVLERAPQAS